MQVGAGEVAIRRAVGVRIERVTQNRRLVYYPDVIKTIERFPADTCEVIYHALEEARLGGKHTFK